MKKKNRDELIDHWADIAATVFHAEDEISGEWFPKLRAAKDLPGDERRQLAEDYLRAIAAEIVDNSHE